jgi:hypothetical protein
MKLITFIITLWAGFVLGRHIGFRDGVEVANFDRNLANQKLQQCLRIVRE